MKRGYRPDDVVSHGKQRGPRIFCAAIALLFMPLAALLHFLFACVCLYADSGPAPPIDPIAGGLLLLVCLAWIAAAVTHVRVAVTRRLLLNRGNGAVFAYAAAFLAAMAWTALWASWEDADPRRYAIGYSVLELACLAVVMRTPYRRAPRPTVVVAKVISK